MKKSELKRLIKEEANKILIPRRSKEERAKKDKRPPSLDLAFEKSPKVASYRDVGDIVLSYQDHSLELEFEEWFGRGHKREGVPKFKGGNIDRETYHSFMMDYFMMNPEVNWAQMDWVKVYWIEKFDKEEAKKWASTLDKKYGR